MWAMITPVLTYRNIIRVLFLIQQLQKFMKCTQSMNSSLLTTCISRIRLFDSYNYLRNKIASGQFRGQPTVGNMMRVVSSTMSEIPSSLRTRKSES